MSARSMWDLADDGSAEDPYAAPPPQAHGPAPEPKSERAAAPAVALTAGPTAGPTAAPEPGPEPASVLYPVGWITVVGGPGTGHAFALKPGVSQIGRGAGQAIRLDFGDLAISREGHALVVYDDETRRFQLGFGGKTNLVRLNGRPVLAQEEIRHGDVVRIGETSLMLTALCGPDFAWEDV